jgi:hypothetical protein
MDEQTRKLDALENIVKELERLRILKEHELGVRLEEAPRRERPLRAYGRDVRRVFAGTPRRMPRPFAMLQRRVGGRLASHPSPLRRGIKAHISAEICALTILQRSLTTLKRLV